MDKYWQEKNSQKHVSEAIHQIFKIFSQMLLKRVLKLTVYHNLIFPIPDIVEILYIDNTNIKRKGCNLLYLLRQKSLLTPIHINYNFSFL